jgi:hypothetical protein
MPERPRVLGDHSRVGKTLVPPLLQYGRLQEVSWANTMLPELAWIGQIQMHHGNRRGVEVTTSLARAARVGNATEEPTVFATASSYGSLSDPSWAVIRGKLLERNELAAIQDALRPMLALYPRFPLAPLFETPPFPPEDGGVAKVSALLSRLRRRADREAMMIQATAIWLVLDAKALVVHEGSSLAQFTEIERYPDTELSRSVGGAIRATLNSLFGTVLESTSPWPAYFWNRGLEVSECRLSDD